LARPDGRGPMVRRTSLLDLFQTTSDSAVFVSSTYEQIVGKGQNDKIAPRRDTG